MKSKIQVELNTFLFVLLLLTGACTKNFSTVLDQGQQVPARQSLLDYLKNNYNFSLFYTSLKKVGLDRRISSDTGQLTVLVPDNDAFARNGITADSLGRMDTTNLYRWMAYHIVLGAVTTNSVAQTIGNSYQTVSGRTIYFSRPVRPGSVQELHINGDTVNNFDLLASNGVIQVMNAPLTPPFYGTVQQYLSQPSFSLFKLTLQKFSLWDTLALLKGPDVVFAPADTAFAGPSTYYDTTTRSNISFSITKDTIMNNWDTARIPGNIFSLYIQPGRIFSTDVTDAPLLTNSPYILPGGQIGLGFTTANNGASSVTVAFFNPDSNIYYRYAVNGAGNFISPSNVVTDNGVIQTLNLLLIAPVTNPR